MAFPTHTTKLSRSAGAVRLARRICFVAFLAVCVFALGQIVMIERFHVPSGSMAPALRGHHRVCDCPRCGHENVVGRANADQKGVGEARFYRKAFCQNCGHYPLPLTDIPELHGDRIMVNKAAYGIRSPRRWEIVVFRLLGAFYIKRILGLPGEEIEIHDGDVYVDSRLLRKDIGEVRALRALVFDHDRVPADGWKQRWEGKAGTVLRLDGMRSPDTLTYQNFSFETGKCEPMRDEYAYNAGLHADAELVHDFSIETEIEPEAGVGTLNLRLCDGRDWVQVLLPIGPASAVEVFAWPIHQPERMCKLAETKSSLNLQPKKRYHVELAFVDRRLTLCVDGRTELSVDLPEARKRSSVIRPFQAHADGVRATLHGFRLYRDVHYGQQGTNAVRGKSVLLGQDQYFMLGDNSPASEDSRFWPDDGRVDSTSLVGPLLFGQHRPAR